MEQRAAVKPGGFGEASCHCKFQACCFDAVKNGSSSTAEKCSLAPSADLRAGRSGCWFVVLCVFPRWVLHSLAAQAFTFLKHFSFSNYI